MRLIHTSCSQQKQREDIYVLYRIHSDAIDIREVGGGRVPVASLRETTTHTKQVRLCIY